MLTRWTRRRDPWLEMYDLMKEMDRIVASAGPPPAGRVRSWMPEAWPAIDVTDEGDKVVVRGDLPGMTEKEVDVTFANGRLVISGEKKSEDQKEREGFQLVERSYGSFSRSVDLGDGVDPERAAASYRNGVLEVRVPKTEASKPRKIDIKGE